MTAPVTAPRLMVIWNPGAGRKAGLTTNQASRDDLLALMHRHGLGDELFETPDARAGTERAAAAARSGYDVVVAAGGDGTAHSVAEGLFATRTALGILPIGSAMNLARVIGIPRDLEAAAAILAQGARASIDVGTIGGRTFHEIVSIGFGAEVFAHAQAVDRRRRWGAIAGLARLATTYRRTRIELQVDDQVVRTRAVAVVVANGPHTGLGLTLAPEASVRDGRLDVVVFEGLSAAGLLVHMVRAIGGRRPPSPFRVLRGRRVRVSTARPLAARADDADIGFTPLELGVRPSALQVIVPAD
jgi:YegS/Rv2252/BmrU family lipid kinase